MTLDLAKQKALELPGCKGFCFKGTTTQALQRPVEMIFKNKWDNAIAASTQWTSFMVYNYSLTTHAYLKPAVVTSKVENAERGVSKAMEKREEAKENPRDSPVVESQDLDVQPDIVSVIGKSTGNFCPSTVVASGDCMVPTFWRHTAQDLGKGFDEKYEVPAERQALLQCLLHDTAGSQAHQGDEVTKTKKLQIVEALRIEDSELWLKYDAAKAAVRERHEKCTRPAAIEKGGPVGDKQVRTERLLQESAKQKEAAATLFANLDAEINEVYLWHGTSRAAWNAISDDGFILRHEGGGRYGPGLYFAEDSVMSLRFAPVHEGQQAVLLCRVVLGEPYYTQSNGSGSLSRLAKADGKDCTFAHPSERWAREFIVFDAHQVYPEYALIVSPGS